MGQATEPVSLQTSQVSVSDMFVYPLVKLAVHVGH